MVSLIADAVVEAKGGVLENAYQEDESVEDITMKDVIINVEQQAAEYERKRRQKYEERRAQMQQRRYNGERRVFRRDANGKFVKEGLYEQQNPVFAPAASCCSKRTN